MLSQPVAKPVWAARQAASEVVGSLLGKQIIVTKDAGTTSLAELRAHLARFNLSWLLRRVGELSAIADRESMMEIGGVALPAYCLPYLALVAIESCSDGESRIPMDPDIAEAARIFNCLPEQTFTSSGDDGRIFEYLIRMGYAQFAGRGDLRNLVARTWLLFGALWSTCERAASFDIDGAIRSEAGLNLRQLMMFGFAFSGHAKPGYMTPYTEEALAKLPAALRAGLEEQTRFLNWVTATYAEVRELAAKSLPDETYDKYRLSPLLIKPVVRPDRPPVEGAEQLRLVPVPRYLVRRVTDGLYHALATANDQGGAANPFRSAFGHVFQEYVGHLLRAACGRAIVLPEWRYGSKGQGKLTPDWIVVDGERAVIIEVKQSAVKLNTKVLGKLDMLATDLKQTLADGAEQLLRFQHDVRARVSGIEKLAAVREIELLVVTHDEIPWANWVMRDTIVKRLKGAEDVHFCSIDDFENLQRYCWGGSPFDLLRAKRRGRDNEHVRDLREWLHSLGEPGTPNHPALSDAFEDLVASWGASKREPAA